MIKGKKTIFTCGCTDPCLEIEGGFEDIGELEGKNSMEEHLSCWCHNCDKTKHFVMMIEIFENTDEDDW